MRKPPRTHAITPTDTAPQPGPDWRYSKPSKPYLLRCADGVVREVVDVDAMQLTMITEHNRVCDAANAKLRGWGTKRGSSK